MTIFDLMLGRDTPSDRIAVAMENVALQDEVRYLGAEIRDVKEDLLKVSDAFDNVGWAPLTKEESAEIPLATVKKVASIARAMNSLNPFVKRGVEARIGYIWGKSVTFDGIDSIADVMDENRKKLFTAQAFEELERVLATDGNAFTALPLDSAPEFSTAFRIVLDQITGAVSNPMDTEEIWYYKREYTVTKTNSITGVVTATNVIKYYASLDYYQKIQKQSKNLPKKWNNVGVEQNYVIQHTAVNRQVGWRWGVPDIMPVIFWAKAYKEYLEDNAMLVKAYSRLAWQYKASSSANGAAASSQIMTPPTRDPFTGELRSVGATNVHGPGGELNPVPNNASSVDFSKGAPLASAVAAGLEVPLTVLTSDAGSSNRSGAESLDLPTLKAMEKRQQVHTERFLEIFEFWGADIRDGASKTTEVKEAATPDKPASTVAIVTWPQIETDSTKDRITALGTAAELGIIYKQEARKEAIDVFGIAPYKPWDELPTMADDPAAQEQMQIQQDNADKEFERQSVIAKQGVSGGTAAKGGSQGTANSSRTNRNNDQNNS